MYEESTYYQRSTSLPRSMRSEQIEIATSNEMLRSEGMMLKCGQKIESFSELRSE